MDNTQDEIEKLNREIIEKDSAIARLKAEYHELNVARLNLKTDKWLSEVKLRREIADAQLVKQQLLKTLASRDREIETLKQELNTLRGVGSAGRLNTERDGKLGSLASSERGGKVTRRIYPHSINGDVDLQCISE